MGIGERCARPPLAVWLVDDQQRRDERDQDKQRAEVQDCPSGGSHQRDDSRAAGNSIRPTIWQIPVERSGYPKAPLGSARGGCHATNDMRTPPPETVRYGTGGARGNADAEGRVRRAGPRRVALSATTF